MPRLERNPESEIPPDIGQMSYSARPAQAIGMGPRLEE